jgi:hypothetical protein
MRFEVHWEGHPSEDDVGVAEEDIDPEMVQAYHARLR